ncbi:MAG: class I SAM-dependent methyltransferase [Candidatus Methanoperedens sp.]|nr:class I SAM-dependent methyltransferase [Candidatus Methanoperedens sp.]MCE8425946.1 class I SAM-dependent methyltransferase [Candidatus Methanoperedens sp.]MCE8427375.1 class I SAM-dependent methyltransferase [Candidatus Methanoperedens sp.]
MAEHIKAWRNEYKRSTWKGYYSLDILEPYYKKGRLLDAGCGSGKYAIPLCMRGFDVVAVDISSGAIGLSMDICEQRGLVIDFLAANVFELPFYDSSFDVVWCYGVVQHLLLKEREAAISEFGRILKNGGILFIEVFGEEDMRYGGNIVEPGTFKRKNGIIYHYFNRTELTDLLKSFTCDIFESKKQKRFEGKYYMRHMITAAARKS